MQGFPHHYLVSSVSLPAEPVQLTSKGLPTLLSVPPLEFGGAGNQWSPETLLVGAVADCFALSFKAIARASHFEWRSLTCDVTGVLDRVDKVMRFTAFEINACLTLAPDASHERALRLLEKAEKSCLITNSLTAEVHLVTCINEVS